MRSTSNGKSIFPQARGLSKLTFHTKQSVVNGHRAPVLCSVFWTLAMASGESSVFGNTDVLEQRDTH